MGEAVDKHYVGMATSTRLVGKNALDAGLEFLRANKENNEYYKLVNTGNPREDFISAYFDRYNGEVLLASSLGYLQCMGKCFQRTHLWYGWRHLNYADMFEMVPTNSFQLG